MTKDNNDVKTSVMVDGGRRKDTDWPPSPQGHKVKDNASYNKPQLTSHLWLDVFIGVVTGLFFWPVCLIVYRLSMGWLRLTPRSTNEVLTVETVALLSEVFCYLLLRRTYHVLANAFVISGLISAIPMFLFLLFGTFFGPPSP